MNKTRWTIFVIIIFGILAMLVAASSSSKIDVNSVDNAKIQVASNQNGEIADHVFGKTDSKVTLIEYGDYQCPPCASIYPQIKSITEEYKDKIRFVFRNFPIMTAHANAKAAAGTAEAAGMQGKYWEMHSKLYENQNDWSSLNSEERTKFFENLAKEIGLDVDKFNNDIAKTNISKKISFDLALGKKAGVEGTPSFFLNGAKVDSEVYGDAEKLKSAIDAELNKLK